MEFLRKLTTNKFKNKPIIIVVVLLMKAFYFAEIITRVLLND